MLKVGRNDRCPCGSGDKYKKCCINKEAEYQKLGVNYKGEEIIFDKSTSNQIYREIRSLNREVFNLKQPIQVNKGLNLLEEYYNLSDRNMKLFSQYASCHKGCSECCYIHVEITAIEAESIREYIINHFTLDEINRIEDKIIEQSRHFPNFKNLYSEKDLEVVRSYIQKEHFGCALLSDNGECLIYQVRPLNCRTFLVASDPDNCKEGRINLEYKSNVIEELNNGLAWLSLRTYPNLVYKNRVLVRYISDWFTVGFRNIKQKL